METAGLRAQPTVSVLGQPAPGDFMRGNPRPSEDGFHKQGHGQCSAHIGQEVQSNSMQTQDSYTVTGSRTHTHYYYTVSTSRSLETRVQPSSFSSITYTGP